MTDKDRRYINTIVYDPSWRGKEARYSDEPSSDPYVKRYRDLLQDPEDNADYSMQVAHDIYRTDWFRCEVEAYLMAKATFEEIAERYDVSPEAIECYARVFFDIGPLKGDGSRRRISNDPSVSPAVRKARQFGYRYGKLFLDWYSSKLSALTAAETAELDACLGSLLHIKIFDLDGLKLKDGDQISTAIKLLDAFSRYKSAVNKGADDKEVNQILDGLRTMVHIAAPPQGLPQDIFQERMAAPPRNGSK